MKKFSLTSLMGGLAVLLWIQAASAGLIGIEVELSNPILTIRGHGGNQTLNLMDEKGGSSLSTHLQEADSPGNLMKSETVFVAYPENASWEGGKGKPGSPEPWSFTMKYAYSYWLKNPRASLTSLKWSVYASLFLDGEQVGNPQKIMQDSFNNLQGLPEISSGQVSGILSFSNTSNLDKLPTGSHVFGVKLDTALEGRSSVPVPSTFLLMGSGLIGLGLLGWRRVRP